MALRRQGGWSEATQPRGAIDSSPRAALCPSAARGPLRSVPSSCLPRSACTSLLSVLLAFPASSLRLGEPPSPGGRQLQVPTQPVVPSQVPRPVRKLGPGRLRAGAPASPSLPLHVLLLGQRAGRPECGQQITSTSSRPHCENLWFPSDSPCPPPQWQKDAVMASEIIKWHISVRWREVEVDLKVLLSNLIARLSP